MRWPTIDKRPYTTKDGKQKVYWRARYRDPRGRERVKNFTRRVDAERFLVGIEHAKLRGEWTEPRLGKIRFDQYAADWLATKADVGPQTLTNVHGRLRKHIVPTFGAMSMAAVRPVDVRNFVARLVASGLGPSTVKGIYLTASQVFAQAATDRPQARGDALPRPRRGRRPGRDHHPPVRHPRLRRRLHRHAGRRARRPAGDGPQPPGRHRRRHRVDDGGRRPADRRPHQDRPAPDPHPPPLPRRDARRAHRAVPVPRRIRVHHGRGRPHPAAELLPPPLQAGRPRGRTPRRAALPQPPAHLRGVPDRRRAARGEHIQTIYRGLVEDTDRTRAICDDIAAAVNPGRNCLVLTRWTEHLNVITEMLSGRGLEPLVLHGKMGKKARTAVTRQLAEPRPDGGLLLVACPPPTPRRVPLTIGQRSAARPTGTSRRLPAFCVRAGNRPGTSYGKG